MPPLVPSGTKSAINTSTGTMMKKKIEGRFWIKKGNKNFLGAGRVELLKNIDKFGSISKAARAMKMSYKAAWDAVDIMNNLSQKPILEKSSGGKGGGGSRLTEYGKKLIKDFEELEKNYKLFLENLENFDKKIYGYKISARNRILCEIENIECEDGICTLTLNLRNNKKLLSKITNLAVEELELKKGDKVIAIIKSTSIKILDRKSSNSIRAKVIDVKKGKNYSTITFETENEYIINAISKTQIEPKNLYYLQIAPEDILIGV